MSVLRLQALLGVRPATARLVADVAGPLPDTWEELTAWARANRDVLLAVRRIDRAGADTDPRVRRLLERAFTLAGAA